MITLKMTGAFLIIFSSAMLGICYAEELKKRIAALMEFRDILCIIKSGMTYSRKMLLDIFEETAQGSNGAAKKFCEIMCREIKENEKKDFYVIWKNAVSEAYKNIVTQEDIELMIKPGKLMAAMDVGLSISKLEECIQFVDKNIQALSQSMPQQYRIRRNMGLFAGLIITIILI